MILQNARCNDEDILILLLPDVTLRFKPRTSGKQSSNYQTQPWHFIKWIIYRQVTF